MYLLCVMCRVGLIKTQSLNVIFELTDHDFTVQAISMLLRCEDS